MVIIKRKQKVIAFVLFLLCLTGCQSETTEAEGTTATITETATVAETTTILETTVEVEETTEVVTEVTTTVETTTSEIIVSDSLTDVERAEIINTVVQLQDYYAMSELNFGMLSKRENYYNTEMFEQQDYSEFLFYDKEVAEKLSEQEVCYACVEVNSEFASTEEELYNIMRDTFTQNYITDEDLHTKLFTRTLRSIDGEKDFYVPYATYDGVLGMANLGSDRTLYFAYDMTEIMKENNMLVVTLYYTKKSNATEYNDCIIYTLVENETTPLKWQIDNIEYKSIT